MSAAGRLRLLHEAGVLKRRAVYLRSRGGADDRWESICVLHDAARREVASLSEVEAPDAAEQARARVEACGLYLLAKDPIRAAAEWACLPRQAFATERGDPPVTAILPTYGTMLFELERAWHNLIGDLGPGAGLRPDQVRALLDAFPGVAELWWALSRCDVSPGEAEMAAARASRLAPWMADPAAAQQAWDSVPQRLTSRWRLDLCAERRGARLALEVVSRVTAVFSRLLNDFAEGTTAEIAELCPAGAAAAEGVYSLEFTARGLHPFALQDLDRALAAPGRGGVARASLELLTSLETHRLSLAACACAPAGQPGLILDERRRRALLPEVESAARRSLDSLDVPQADDLERLFRTVEHIAATGREGPELSPRQVSYYRRAARILGLLDEAGAATPAGRLIAGLDPAARLRVGAVLFEASACGGAWISWQKGRSLLDVDPGSAADFLRASAPGLSRDTADRRAQTLIAWRRALIDHHYAAAHRAG